MEWKLSDSEDKKCREWNEKHKAERHDGKEPYAGAVGGRLTFSVTPTSIGEFVSVKCGLCGEEESLTDFEDL